MSLRCLAILGSKNEPLYMCASGPTEDGDDHETVKQGGDKFGFFGDDDDISKKNASGFLGRPASIRHEVRFGTVLFCVVVLDFGRYESNNDRYSNQHSMLAL